MTEQKVAEERLFRKPCIHPDHKPASMKVRPPGVYTHTCPACGQESIFRVIDMGLIRR